MNALLRWYRARLDVQAKLPFLATYPGSNGGVPPSVVERASSARPRSGRAAAVNKCGSGSPTSTRKCGGSRPPHPGHRDCQPGAPAGSTLWNSAAFGAARKSCNGCRGGTPGCPPHERRRPPTSSTSCSPWLITPAALGHRRWPASRPQVLGDQGDAGSCDPNWGQSVSPPSPAARHVGVSELCRRTSASGDALQIRPTAGRVA